MKRIRFHSIVLVLVLAVLAGCAAPRETPSPLTPQEQFLMAAESTYTMVFNDTMTMAKDPRTTPAQWEVIKRQKAALTQARPLIDAYGATVTAGGIPPQTAKDAINAVFNEIGYQVTKPTK